MPMSALFGIFVATFCLDDNRFVMSGYCDASHFVIV